MATPSGKDVQIIKGSGAVVVVQPGVDAGQAARAAQATAGEEKDADAAPSGDEEQVTHHSLNIDGKPLAYTARAGRMPIDIEDDEETGKAHVFYVAYTLDGVEDPATRPITYCFNGGPGSSSVWLHLGAYGPRRVVLPDDASQPKPPFTMVDNEHSLLDLTDLVFIDPVTTGFSRAAEGVEDKPFHGVDADVRSVGEFIRLYTTRHNRWASPKLLSGESYGTTRAAALAGHLQDRHGIFLNGIALVSMVLDFSTILPYVGNDVPYPLFLPTYTATAWYHGLLDEDRQADLRATLDEAEAFADGEYAAALLAGDRMDAQAAARIAERLADLTGLSTDFIQRCNLRVGPGRFFKELRRDERLTVGRLDSRYVGRDRDAAGESIEFDPSMHAILGPYTAAFNDHVRRTLEFESDLHYEILTGRVHPWSFDEAKNRFLNVAETLRSAMSRNPHLKVHIANGYYDLATPYHASAYTVAHLGLDPELQGNISQSFYEAGHMMYVHSEELARMKAALAEFYGIALS
jgi:carboxypeptidase C (cathepsin A)